MARRRKMIWPYPYMMPPMPNSGGEDQLTTYMRYRDFFDKMAKEAEDKKKNEKKKPEPSKFTFLETFGMTLFLGPFLGFGYLYTVKLALHQVELMFK